MTRMIMLLTLMAVCHNMQGVTVFGYTFDMPLTSRISALYNTAYTYVVADRQTSIEPVVVDRQPVDVPLNDQAVQRTARIMGHIALEDCLPITLAPCSSSPIQRTCRILEHIAPEHSSRHNVYPAPTNGAYVPTMPWQLNQGVQNMHNRSNRRLSRIMGHLTPDSNAKSAPIAAQPTAAHSNSEIQRAVENFAHIDKNTVLDLIRRYREEAWIAFVSAALENFAQTDSEVLLEIIRFNPGIARVFVKDATENFAKTSAKVLCLIMHGCPEAAKAFVEPAIEHFAVIDPAVLVKIIKHCPEAKSRLLVLIKQRLPYIFDGSYMTQTQQLTKMQGIKYYLNLFDESPIRHNNVSIVQDIANQVIELERQEQEKGRYTFVHGHLWRYHFTQETYTDLWRIVHGPVDRFRYVRYKNPAQLPIENFFAYIKQEQERREQLMNNGSVSDMSYDQDCMLFMNYALFCNYQGSNTAVYILANYSQNPIDIACSAFMEELQLDRFLTTNELGYIAKRFKQLKQEHAVISECGGGLLLSFTPEMLKKCVYPCHPAGKKRTVEIAGIGETADPQVILDTLRTEPEKIKDSDHMEFACVLTHDCALIPNNGLDIYEFNAANQEKLAVWRAKKDRLMAWIQERVNRRREAQIQTRL